jgi:hypothetical protein
MNDIEPEAIMALLIPILAIVFGCSIPLLAIFLSYRKRKAIYELHHKERMAAIEKGIDLPPLPESFFKDNEEQPKEKNPRGSVLTGMVWFFIGLGLGVWWYTDHASYAGLALIPMGIGIAYIFYYILEGRKAPTPGSIQSEASGEQS